MGKRKVGHKRRVHPEGRLRDEILRRLQRVDQGAWGDRLALPDGFSRSDRRRITEYERGITRGIRRLDFLINSLSKRSGEIDPVVRQILRIGAYELVELHRPAHSVVFASVEQAKRLVGRGVDKFVNGLLRTLSGRVEELPEPETGDPVTDLGILYSHPDWMVRRWVSRFGPDEAKLLMEWNNRRPVHSLRVNTLKLSVEDFCRKLDWLGVGWQASRYLSEFLHVDRLQPVVEGNVFGPGLAAIQDESAGLVGRVLGPRSGEFIIDACAAPGGKLIHAGIVMEDRGRLVGIDPNEKRLARALAAAEAHGLSIVETIAGDFRSMAPDDRLSEADAVLLDAPCSGLGVLARRSDLRWRRPETSIRELTELQDQLLDAAAAFVKPGGRLVYATCTITPEENEERVTEFLRRHSSFALQSVKEWVDSSVERDGYLVTLPQVHRMDGAFAAVLRRG